MFAVRNEKTQNEKNLSNLANVVTLKTNNYYFINFVRTLVIKC